MSEPRLSLKWESYEKNICNGLGLLQQRGEFVDMTIAADGHHVKVHQMILSLVSPIIKELIASAQCSHPVVFLHRVSYQTLQLILEYVYTGEVLVTRDKLEDFLEACRALSIKGLESDTMTTSSDRASLHELCPTDVSAPTQMPKIRRIAQTTTKRRRTESPEMDDVEIFLDNASEIDDSQMESSAFDEADYDEVIISKSNNEDPQAEEKSNTSSSSMLQYSLSCQGSIQVVLNRFIYHMRHTRKNNEIMWRCADYNKSSCTAFVVTKENKVVQRGCAHNHSFHDEQILKRVRCGNLFSALNTVKTMVSMKKKLPDT